MFLKIQKNIIISDKNVFFFQITAPVRNFEILKEAFILKSNKTYLMIDYVHFS